LTHNGFINSQQAAGSGLRKNQFYHHHLGEPIMAKPKTANVELVDVKTEGTPFGTKTEFNSRMKVKTLSEVVKNPENDSATLTIFWAFKNGNVVSHSVLVNSVSEQHPLISSILVHGLIQKVGDGYSSVSEPDDVQANVEMVLANLEKGIWTRQTEGTSSSIAGITGDLIEAVRRTFASVGQEKFVDEENGRVAAKTWLIDKYNKVMEAANELLNPTGDEAQDAANAKAAEEMQKKPFAKMLQSADLQRHLADIREAKRAKAEADRMAKLQEEGVSLLDFAE
jgi:hypothetical protein